jgi:hypothetical protein
MPSCAPRTSSSCAAAAGRSLPAAPPAGAAALAAAAAAAAAAARGVGCCGGSRSAAPPGPPRPPSSTSSVTGRSAGKLAWNLANNRATRSETLQLQPGLSTVSKRWSRKLRTTHAHVRHGWLPWLAAPACPQSGCRTHCCRWRPRTAGQPRCPDHARTPRSGRLHLRPAPAGTLKPTTTRDDDKRRQWTKPPALLATWWLSQCREQHAGNSAGLAWHGRGCLCSSSRRTGCAAGSAPRRPGRATGPPRHLSGATDNRPAAPARRGRMQQRPGRPAGAPGPAAPVRTSG